MYPGTSIILKIKCEHNKEDSKEATFNLDALMVFHRCKQPMLPEFGDRSTQIKDIPCPKSVYLDENQLMQL